MVVECYRRDAWNRLGGFRVVCMDCGLPLCLTVGFECPHRVPCSARVLRSRRENENHYRFYCHITSCCISSHSARGSASDLLQYGGPDETHLVPGTPNKMSLTQAFWLLDSCGYRVNKMKSDGRYLVARGCYSPCYCPTGGRFNKTELIAFVQQLSA